MVRSVRRVKTREPIPQDNIQGMIRRAGKLRDKAFIAFLYMAAARVSEVVRIISRKHFKVEDEYLLVKIPTLKNRREAYRIIPMPLKNKYTRLIRRYLEECEEDVLWGFSRQYALKLLKKLGGEDVFPHLFRHTRLTQLVEYGDMNEFELTAYAGWTDPRPAKDYIHLKWRPLAVKVRKADGNG